MLIVPILLLVMALGYGFSVASSFNWGIEFINLAFPYYKLGIIFEQLIGTSKDGEVYRIHKLTLGLIVINIYINFFHYIGPTQSTTITLTPNDTTVNPTSPAV